MLLAFFGLTFAASWLLWAGALTVLSSAEGGGASSAFAQAVFLLGVFAPGLTALGLTYHEGGTSGVKRLLARIIKAQVELRWYLFALAFMPLTKLVVALLHRLVLGEWPVFGPTPWYLMAGAILISTWTQAGEEVGWRGYALKHLTDRFGLAPASLILGVMWALWHLPLFFVPAADTYGQSFPMYLAQVTALTVAMAWLYWRTQGSLLLVMILHASVNNTKDIVPSAAAGASDVLSLGGSPVGWLTVLVLWVSVAPLLIRMRSVRNWPER